VLLFVAAAARPATLFQCAGPVLYALIFVTVAYSLSAGNAGTGFRYRTHVVLLGMALFAAIWRVGPRQASHTVQHDSPGHETVGRRAFA
jgi:hypothetical protein